MAQRVLRPQHNALTQDSLTQLKIGENCYILAPLERENIKKEEEI